MMRSHERLGRLGAMLTSLLGQPRSVANNNRHSGAPVFEQTLLESAEPEQDCGPRAPLARATVRTAQPQSPGGTRWLFASAHSWRNAAIGTAPDFVRTAIAVAGDDVSNKTAGCGYVVRGRSFAYWALNIL